VRGEVIFDENTQPFTGATVTVSLEDVNLADAASKTVAKVVFRDVAYSPESSSPLQFSLEGLNPDEKTSYNIRVHADLDNDGQVSRGDYLTMQSYPVLTYGNPTEVSVRVQQVK